MKKYISLGLYCIIGVLFQTQAQTQFIKNGITTDSQTLEPIALVYVQSLITKNVATTNDKGEFQILSAAGDSLIFSRLGYNIKKIFVGIPNESTVVMLSETQMILPELSVYGNFEPQGKTRWFESIRTPKPYDNPTYKPGNEYTMQTFGSGYTIIGPISYFLKSEKEKRKLKKFKEERNKTIVYNIVISDPETKTLIMHNFNITQEKYEAKIEQFILSYPDAAYINERTELIDLLYYFFSLKRLKDD